MAYSPQENGARQTITRRVGRDFDAFSGEATSRDAARLGPNDFVSAINADVQPRRVTPRPGEAKVLASPLGAAVKGMWDLESDLA